jgi:hypothetical protein
LFVAGVLADDADDAFATDDFALVADLLDRRADLHGGLRGREWEGREEVSGVRSEGCAVRVYQCLLKGAAPAAAGEEGGEGL